MADRIGDPLRLTRRDRAALVLALELLRRAHGADIDHRHRQRVLALDSCVDALRLVDQHVWADAVEECGVGIRTTRYLVARLALALRAILRADEIERNDWRPRYEMRTRVVCAGCGDILPAYAHGEKTSAACPRTGRAETARNAIPLWELAPTTRLR